MIEKNIPLPPKDSLAGLFRQLAVGDSVLIPIKRRTAVGATSFNLGITTRTRKEGDMVRVWRTQ